MKKPSNDIIIQALEKSGGIVTEASERLKVSRKSLYDWMKEDPELREYQLQQKQNLIELARKGLKEKLQEGSEKSIHFVLEKLDKESGFTTRIEVTGADGKPLEQNINYTELSEQTLREIAEKHRAEES